MVSFVKPYFGNKLVNESSAACVAFKRINFESDKTSNFSLASSINNLFKVHCDIEIKLWAGKSILEKFSLNFAKNPMAN
jgi:hypothetical protein